MELLQNKLIDKAYALKFESYFGRMTSVNEKCYHLWLADFQKWLREIHNIHIMIDPNLNNFLYWFNIVTPYESGIQDDEFYNTYEQALEAGLLKSLTLIN